MCGGTFLINSIIYSGTLHFFTKLFLRIKKYLYRPEFEPETICIVDMITTPVLSFKAGIYRHPAGISIFHIKLVIIKLIYNRNWTIPAIIIIYRGWNRLLNSNIAFMGYLRVCPQCIDVRVGGPRARYSSCFVWFMR